MTNDECRMEKGELRRNARVFPGVRHLPAGRQVRHSPFVIAGPFRLFLRDSLVDHQYSPNAFQGLGNKLYNHMCCGQPVIGPAGSGSEDIIRQYDRGLSVDTSKPEEIAEAMERIYGQLARELRAPSDRRSSS